MEHGRDRAGAGPGNGSHIPTVAASATIEPSVAIGAGVRIAPGAYIGAGCSIGADVVIGPNAVVGGSDWNYGSPAAPVTLREGCSIGANATVLGGATVGKGASVGAGAVVTRDVPPYAKVIGSPARISGYVSASQSPQLTLRASTLDQDSLPMALGSASILSTPVITDLRGSLTFAETGGSLPFAVERYFLVYDVPSREVRGEHAHRALQQFLVCPRGECRVAVDDGATRGEVVLDHPGIGVHLPPMVWGTQYDYSTDAVLLVLASGRYDATDYIRDYDEFTALVHGG